MPFHPSAQFPSKALPCLSGVTLLDMLLALSANITLGWEGLPGTNTLAYLALFEDTTKKGL